MTGKLFGYLFRETWRSMRFIYLIALIFSISSGLIITNSNTLEWLLFVNTMIWVFAMIMSVLGSLIVSLITDYKNTQGSRAYFFRSIPARNGELYLARFVHLIVYELLSLVTIVIGGVIIGLVGFMSYRGSAPEGIIMQIIRMFQRQFAQIWQTGIIQFLFLTMIGYLLFATIYSLFCITIGSSTKFQRLRFGGVILAYFVFNIVLSSASGLADYFVQKFFAIEYVGDIPRVLLVTTQNYNSITDAIFNNYTSPNFLVGIGMIIVYIVFGVIFITATLNYQKKRISLK